MHKFFLCEVKIYVRSQVPVQVQYSTGLVLVLYLYVQYCIMYVQLLTNTRPTHFAKIHPQYKFYIRYSKITVCKKSEQNNLVHTKNVMCTNISHVLYRDYTDIMSLKLIHTLSFKHKRPLLHLIFHSIPPFLFFMYPVLTAQTHNGQTVG